jgi:TIR domain
MTSRYITAALCGEAGRARGGADRVDEYQFDVFVSYSRRGHVAAWVQEHFEPVLRNCLIDELGPHASVFIDTRMEVGTPWPLSLVEGLRRSRLVVPVWSAPYFVSRWCLAEWQTIRARERMEGRDQSPGSRLVYPLVFADGSSFPQEARDTQSVAVKEWGYPYPHFKESPAYLPFHAVVRSVAEELVARLRNVPAWRSDWPVVRPDGDPPPPPPANLPEL